MNFQNHKKSLIFCTGLIITLYSSLSYAVVTCSFNASSSTETLTSSYKFSDAQANPFPITSVSITCSGTYPVFPPPPTSTPVTITFNPSANATGSNCSTTYRMRNISNYLSYKLCKDNNNSCTQFLAGTCTSVALAVPYTGGAANSATATIYGVIPSGQNVPAGIYSDSVNVTANY